MKNSNYRILRQSETQTVVTDNYGIVVTVKKTVDEAKAFILNVLQRA